jgi:hypothetical protein
MGKIPTKAGDIEVLMTYDNAIITSTAYVPDAVDVFKEIGDLTEHIEESIGVIKLGSLSVSLKESYKDFSVGFWFKLLSQSSPSFLFLLYENDDPTYYFSGEIDKQSSEADELFVLNPGTSGTYNRAVSIELLDSMSKLMDVTGQEIVDAIIATGTVYNHENGVDVYTLMSFDVLFNKIFSAAFGGTLTGIILSPQFDEGFETYQDVFLQFDAVEYLFKDVHFVIKKGATTSPFFDSTSDVFIGKRFENALKYLGYICRAFGFLPRYCFGDSNGEYDGATPSNNSHRVLQLYRGRITNSDDVLDFESREKKPSTINFFTDAKAANIRVANAVDFESREGFHEIKTDWIFHQDYSLTNWYQRLFFIDAGEAHNFDGIQYFDHSTGSYVAQSSEGENSRFEQAISNYYNKRFSKESMRYNRAYRGITGKDANGESHTKIRPMRITTIHDGVSSKSFYANRTVKNASKNHLSIEWIRL